jgi:mycofactocin system glycosyltransferase
MVSAGAFAPHPTKGTLDASAVTVVIPVRDRPDHLERLLSSLEGLACVVIDDASTDASLTKKIAESHRAHFIGLPSNGGPSVARNAGLAMVDTPLVAFVDSDCVPSMDWLLPLLGHFDDPLVAAVAPRIVPTPTAPPTSLSRYEAVRSSLDRGTVGGLVRPLSRIPYVPSAALIVRRDVAGAHLFDPGLRGGEDVDLVWRLVDAGWDVRFDPASTVHHEGPSTPTAFLARRAFYGSAAAPLAQRHPDNLAPLTTSVWTAAVWAFALIGRPMLALETLAASIFVLARRLTGLVRDPVKVATQIAGGGTAKAALPAWAGLTRTWAPAFALGMLSRRTRNFSAAALLVPAIGDWIGNPSTLDLARYAAWHVADDVAYGTGVWAGCARARSARPLLPRLSVRARVWSTDSLRTQLGGGPSDH